MATPTEDSRRRANEVLQPKVQPDLNNSLPASADGKNRWKLQISLRDMHMRDWPWMALFVAIAAWYVQTKISQLRADNIILKHTSQAAQERQAKMSAKLESNIRDQDELRRALEASRDREDQYRLAVDRLENESSLLRAEGKNLRVSNEQLQRREQRCVWTNGELQKDVRALRWDITNKTTELQKVRDSNLTCWTELKYHRIMWEEWKERSKEDTFNMKQRLKEEAQESEGLHASTANLREEAQYCKVENTFLSHNLNETNAQLERKKVESREAMEAAQQCKVEQAYTSAELAWAKKEIEILEPCNELLRESIRRERHLSNEGIGGKIVSSIFGRKRIDYD